MIRRPSRCVKRFSLGPVGRGSSAEDGARSAQTTRSLRATRPPSVTGCGRLRSDPAGMRVSLSASGLRPTTSRSDCSLNWRKTRAFPWNGGEIRGETDSPLEGECPSHRSGLGRGRRVAGSQSDLRSLSRAPSCFQRITAGSMTPQRAAGYAAASAVEHQSADRRQL